jgi:trans-aconitate methyltransferase
MYADPRHIRNITIKVSVNEQEAIALEATSYLEAEQKATLVREKAFSGAMQWLDDHPEALDRLAKEQPMLLRKLATHHPELLARMAKKAAEKRSHENESADLFSELQRAA